MGDFRAKRFCNLDGGIGRSGIDNDNLVYQLLRRIEAAPEVLCSFLAIMQRLIVSSRRSIRKPRVLCEISQFGFIVYPKKCVIFLGNDKYLLLPRL